KGSLKVKSGKIFSKAVDAMNVKVLSRLIKDTHSSIVINLGTAYINMSVLEACIQTGATYMDTAIHEDPKKVCEDPPWYGNYEWKRQSRCTKKGISAIVGVGLDPGVVNAYCAWASIHEFDTIDPIDIVDVNAGRRGKDSAAK